MQHQQQHQKLEVVWVMYFVQFRQHKEATGVNHNHTILVQVPFMLTVSSVSDARVPEGSGRITTTKRCTHHREEEGGEGGRVGGCKESVRGKRVV